MKPIILVTSMVLISIISLQAQYNEDNLTLESTTSLSRYHFGSLQLYPIRANKTFLNHHKDLGNYVSLEEALVKNHILVTEYKNGRSTGTVNKLYVENISSDTIMILAGEVLQGGKQDRMIAEETILYPGSGKKEVPVFCVEHGRWRANKDGLSFNRYYSISSNEVRKAGTVKKDQQEVWDKVSETTVKNNARTSTGTLAGLQQSESFNQKLERYKRYFENLCKKEPDVIGMIAVSGNAILGCDMFATHALFEKHYDNLINSYATEAITSGGNVTVPYEQVKQYLLIIIKDEAGQEEVIQENGTLLKDGNRKVHIATF